LSAFIKQIVYEFNKRWHEEQESDCKTPMHRRLTHDMRRELVKSLRTPTLLAMFSQDSSTVSSIQSCLKSMSVMEPELILYPILERAFPALEALVEVGKLGIPSKRC
jgi:proteasome activator subunit 4